MKNILFIMGDQHRQDCIGCYGNKDVKTPNLDAIAKDGIIHKEHYTTYPVCTPARYSILSGLYTHQHAGWGNHCTLASGINTYPKILKQAGYKTCAVGKMHCTPTYLDVGFDKMILAEQDGDGRYDDDYHRYLMKENVCDTNDMIDQRQEFRKRADDNYWDNFGAVKSNLDEKHHSTTWITDRALEEIENWGKNPNMLFVSYIKPHHPFDPPEPFDTLYNPNDISILDGYTEDVPEVDYKHSRGYFDHKNLTKDRLKKIMSYYYGSITHMDMHIGRIIKSLKEKNLYDDTMIIYTSDHGDYMGYHHMMLKANYMYDPLVKVPLIIKYPNNAHSGNINNNISENIDIAPTIIKQSGQFIPSQMKGLDLYNQNASREFAICEGLRVEHLSKNKEFYYEYMVRSKNYKLIINKNLESYRFFDLSKDPYELDDVANDSLYEKEIKKHIDYLIKTIIFNTPTPIYLNKQEKVCDSKEIKENREEIEKYYIKKFEDELS